MTAVLDWLLEKENPSVRYFALRQLLDRAEADAEAQSARRAIMRSDPVRKILAAQHAEGYWVRPGSGYSPKYQSTAWQILFLAELGADGRSRQVRKGCEYLLTHAPAEHGGFSAYTDARPSGAIYCLNGNLIWALVALGYGGDERVRRAVNWLAALATGEGSAALLTSGMSRPRFGCVANGQRPCAWGVVKALRALANLPAEMRTRRVQRATTIAAEFILGRDLAKADYPYTRRVSGGWFKLGFPLGYTSDVLEALLALGEAGHGRDPRLNNAIGFVLSKRAANGRWALKHSLNGKMWSDIEQKGQPGKWVTLRAMRALKLAGRM